MIEKPRKAMRPSICQDIVMLVQQCHKPAISSWFKPPIHDRIGEGLLIYHCLLINGHLFGHGQWFLALPQPGNALMRQGAWVEAIGFFDAALNLLGDRGESRERQRRCWMHMAFCHLNLEEYQAAIEYLDLD